MDLNIAILVWGQASSRVYLRYQEFGFAPLRLLTTQQRALSLSRSSTDSVNTRV